MNETAPVKAPLGYFDQQVLAAYRNESDRCQIETDFFEGHVTVRSDYYERLDEVSRDECYIDVRFGYRALVSGDLAVVAWLPDLVEKSKSHVNRWQAFLLDDPQWAPDDERFELWRRRYVEGDWDVDNGVRAQLAELVETARGLTGAVLGIPLFKHSIPASLSFPAAQNTDRYQDAHRNLYLYLVDGLDKACLKKLAAQQGDSVSVEGRETVKTLKRLLPALGPDGPFSRAVDRVSAERRRAGHEVHPAEPFGAFEKFTEDLELVAAGLQELIRTLETATSVNAERAAQRWRATLKMPKIARPSGGHDSIRQADLMKGKTVASVEHGFRHDIEGVHESELLILHFTDGSIAAIHTGSNAGNLAHRHSGLEPDEFRVSFHIHWVPSL